MDKSRYEDLDIIDNLQKELFWKNEDMRPFEYIGAQKALDEAQTRILAKASEDAAYGIDISAWEDMQRERKQERMIAEARARKRAKKKRRGILQFRRAI